MGDSTTADSYISPDDTDGSPNDKHEDTTEPTGISDFDEGSQQVTVIFQSDAWDNVGWGNEPIKKQVQEEYRGQVNVYDDIVAVREFNSPSEMKEKWEQDVERHEMPVDSSVWNGDVPKSTELSDRAFLAAQEQGHGRAGEYLRRLRIAAIVEGRNIEDKQVLEELAEEAGLDIEQFRKDWENKEVRTDNRDPDTPMTVIEVGKKTATHPGYLHINDLKTIFEQAGLEEQDPRPLLDFVREHGPITTKEVVEVYGYMSEKDATEDLRETENVRSTEIGVATFWTTAP